MRSSVLIFASLFRYLGLVPSLGYYDPLKNRNYKCREPCAPKPSIESAKSNKPTQLGWSMILVWEKLLMQYGYLECLSVKQLPWMVFPIQLWVTTVVVGYSEEQLLPYLSLEQELPRGSINCYFDLLEKSLDDHCLHEQPSLILWMRQEFHLILALWRLFMKRNQYLLYTSGSKSQVTVVACVSASGQTIPPLIIWKRKTISSGMANGEMPGTQYGFSDTFQIFRHWLDEG